MTTAYPMLTYPYSVLGSPGLGLGTLCGCDELGRPYEVLDVEVFGTPPDEKVHVFLQYATAENINRQMAKLQAILTGGTLDEEIRA